MKTMNAKQQTLPAKLDPSDVVAIIDSREQSPLDLSPLQTVVAGLDTGDYSIVGLEHVVRVERKSLGDLVGCVGRERERFQREVDRLLAYPVRILLVEATWASIEMGGWRGSVTPSQVVGSLIGWQASGLAVQMVGTHERAGQFVSRLLYTVARRRYAELRTAFCLAAPNRQNGPNPASAGQGAASQRETHPGAPQTNLGDRMNGLCTNRTMGGNAGDCKAAKPNNAKQNAIKEFLS